MRLVQTKRDWMHLSWALGLYEDFKGLEDLLSYTPSAYEWVGVDGWEWFDVFVAYLGNGEKVELKTAKRWEYANRHEQPEEEDAPTVGEQIAQIEKEGHKVMALEVWGYDDRNDPPKSDRFLIILKPLDYKKIRRRIEDALRKTTDKQTLVRIAQELGVKLV